MTYAREFADEHSFLSYWVDRLSKQVSANRLDFLEIMASPYARSTSDYIVRQLCVQGKIAVQDIDWLFSTLSPGGDGWKQLCVLKCLDDPQMEWSEKFKKVFAFQGDWAVARLLHSMPIEAAQQAKQIIMQQRCGKGRKYEYLNLVDETVANGTLQDPGISWDIKLTRILEVHQTTAACKLLAALPREHEDAARAIIMETALGAKMRRRLLQCFN